MKGHGEWQTRWKMGCSCGGLLALGKSGVDLAGIENVAIAFCMRVGIKRVEAEISLGDKCASKE